MMAIVYLFGGGNLSPLPVKAIKDAEQVLSITHPLEPGHHSITQIC